MLWAKDLPLDEKLHRFTVGDDPQVDLEILEFDALASAAHARGLAKIGALTNDAAAHLSAQLATLAERAKRRELVIRTDQEDGHTLLEEELGELGKKIHLGRSRNDQVAVSVRLWMRDRLLLLSEGTLALIDALLAFGDEHAQVPMPGYTHGRRAMPSSIGQWTAAYVAGLIEELEAFQALDVRLNRCPLGSGAGYGVPVALDREYVAEILGFERVQIAPVDVQNSRGRHERAFLSELASVALVLERLCQDLWLFTTEEFGFFALPDAFTTGSSIMPQKRNPDAIELVRGRAREVRGYAATLDHLAGGLSGGYHRDFQLLKRPLIEATRVSLDLLDVMTHLIPGLRLRRDRLDAAMSDDLYATQVAYELVQSGLPFRDAYREVAAQVANRTLQKPEGEAPSHLGSPTQPGLNLLRAEAASLATWPSARREQISSTKADLFDARPQSPNPKPQS